jgi:hypothetical protein
MGTLRDARPLWESPCFNGECPSRSTIGGTVVCPSGFWGYRHALGLPASVGNDSQVEASFRISLTEAPDMTVGVSTDPALVLREQHERVLQGLRMDLGWHEGNSRKLLIQMLRTNKSHIVYFYCHGGLQDGRFPYLQVGPLNEAGITCDNLRGFKIRWKAPRPLVFINGCNTAALDPDRALEFVTAFVRTAHAAGLIGTETTVYESLACSFSEACLRYFMVDGLAIGEAVRRARLVLLKNGNPLGLVYTPFVIASLKLGA